jgi:hypothetical protein
MQGNGRSSSGDEQRRGNQQLRDVVMVYPVSRS